VGKASLLLLQVGKNGVSSSAELAAEHAPPTPAQLQAASGRRAHAPDHELPGDRDRVQKAGTYDNIIV